MTERLERLGRLGRRVFFDRVLKRWGGGWLLLSLGVTTGTTSCGTVRSEFENVGTLLLLEETGGILQEHFSSEPLLVVNPKPQWGKGKEAGKLLRPESLAAVSPACPHQGCLVKWQQKHRAFVCPCHGSRFGSDGKVLQGPTQKNLKTYAVELRGDDIWVSSQPL